MRPPARLALGAVAVGLALPATGTAATIKPTVLADDLATNGNCTLREAVEAATTNAPVDECPKGQKSKADKIPLVEGTYALDSGDDDDNLVGDLDIDGGGQLAILGRGTGKTTIDGPSTDRALDLLFPDDTGPTVVTVSKLTIDGGDGGLRGGAIRADAGPDSALTLDRTKLENGEAQFGGGISLLTGKLRVKRSLLEGNLAEVDSTGQPGIQAAGGAIEVTGASLEVVSAVISDTTFLDNNARMNDSMALGGAVSVRANGSLLVRRSVFEQNDAFSAIADTATHRWGGAIYMDAADQDLRVINSTFYLNRAFGAGSSALGGAVYAGGGPTEIVHSTFLDNGATGGSAFALEPDAGTLELSRSVFDAAAASSAPCLAIGENFESEGYNVSTDPWGCDLNGPKDLLADPLLDVVPKDNGGLTETIKLLKGSPAIDRIPKRSCKPAEGEDQRRYRRPAGKRCDSGAYERGAKRR